MISMTETQLDGCPAFCLKDGDAPLAYCLYTLKGEIIDILQISPDCEPLLRALGLAVLSKMEYQGLTEAFCRNKALETWLLELRFAPCEEGWKVSLTGYFDSPCCGKDVTR